MKRVLAAVAALLLAAALFSGCANEMETVTPPFWKATSPAGETVYLLGSMHAGKKNVEYPEYILNAFDECGSVICEVDTIAFAADADENAKCLALLSCPEGKTAQDYFGADYSAVKKFFQKNGIYNPVYSSYMPVMWTSALSNAVAKKCGLSSEFGTEYMFLTRAREQEKVVIEAETALSQYEVLAKSPVEYDVYTLSAAAQDGIAAQIESMNELYNAWAEFDGDALREMLNESVPEEFSQDYEEYCRAMYSDRQEIMAQCLTDADKSAGVFMFVGALHFYAENDIISILESARWTVEEIRGEESIAA